MSGFCSVKIIHGLLQNGCEGAWHDCFDWNAWHADRHGAVLVLPCLLHGMKAVRLIVSVRAAWQGAGESRPDT